MTNETIDNYGERERNTDYVIIDDMLDDIPDGLPMFPIIPYLMLYRNIPRFNFGFGGQSIETYGSKAVHRIDSSDWKSMEHNKIGRNESCPCGSGKKYKRCCAF